jgi:hypothetical protein
LGLSLRGTDDLIREVRKGLPFKTLESLSLESGISVSDAVLLNYPESGLLLEANVLGFVGLQMDTVVRTRIMLTDVLQ